MTVESGGLLVMLIGLERQSVPREDVETALVFGCGRRKPLTSPVKKVQERWDTSIVTITSEAL